MDPMEELFERVNAQHEMMARLKAEKRKQKKELKLQQIGAINNLAGQIAALNKHLGSLNASIR